MSKFIAKAPNTKLPEPEPIAAGSFDVVELLDKGGEILRREILNLMSESSRGKLSPPSAKDLVAYVKLLSDMRTSQEESVENLDEEALRKLVEK